MKKILLSTIVIPAFLFLLIFPFGRIEAQNQPRGLSCGTSPDDLHTLFENMMTLRSKYANVIQARGAVSYVPVCFHLVAKADGTGRVNESKLLDMIDQWNITYAKNNLELQFYIKYLNYVDHDGLYNAPRAISGANKAFALRKSDALNIFICGTADDGLTPNSTTLAYYINRYSIDDAPYASDWIVMRYQEAARENSSTVEHEIGHLFSLPHTFQGFECTPFSPTQAAPCAPALVNCNGRNYAVEKAARTGSDANCSTAGDGFCDTPPDYNFGFTQGTDWNNNNKPCVYNGIAKDPTCIALDPDETNLMGYYIGCENTFSPMQVSAIKNDYANSFYRKYLRDGNVVPLTAPVGEATLQVPANNATTQFFNNINFDWTDVAGAYAYVFEISTFASFTANVKRFVVYSSNINLNPQNVGATYLTANRTYYWQVRAFGRYVTGTNFAVSNKFITSGVNTVREIQGVENLTVSPNPVNQSQSLEMRMTSDRAFDAVVKWQNTAGQVMKIERIRIESGFNARLLDTAPLNEGMYILSLESETGVLNKKVFITR